jgi:TRAP-type C4-dicarboxylate transport system permease small subunit
MTDRKPGVARRALDLFYTGCGVLAGVSLVSIAVLVLLQIVARILGAALTWTDEFAGYAMAASSFLALAYTFNTGGHIRVAMLLNVLPSAGKRWLDALCLLTGIGITGYFAWSSAVMTWQSYVFDEMGQGVFAVPLWIPQIAMTLGIVALLVALLDNLACLIFRGTTFYQDQEAPSVT